MSEPYTEVQARLPAGGSFSYKTHSFSWETLKSWKCFSYCPLTIQAVSEIKCISTHTHTHVAQASQVATVVKNPPAHAGNKRTGSVCGREDPLEGGTAARSSILARRSPWTEESGGLPSIGSQSQTQLKRLSDLVRSTHIYKYSEHACI